MFGSIVKDMLVNLISHCNDTPFHAEISDELHFFLGKNFASRIIGCIDDDGLRFVIKGLSEFLLIKVPIWFMEGDDTRLRVTEDSIRTIIFIKRFEHNDL